MFPCTKLRMAGIFYIQLRLDASAASMRLEVLQLLKTFTLLLLSLSFMRFTYDLTHQWCDVYYCIPHISEIRNMILMFLWSCLGKNTTSKFAKFWVYKKTQNKTLLGMKNEKKPPRYVFWFSYSKNSMKIFEVFLLHTQC